MKRESSSAPLKREPEPVNWHGQPERICGNCQHYRARQAVKERGDCHNLISGTWECGSQDAACRRGWYPAVDRWPIEKIYHA